MPVRAHPPVLYFEYGDCHTLRLPNGRTGLSHGCGRFRIGRIVDGSGGTRRFSGPPPHPWTLEDEDGPAPFADRAAIEAALLRLSRLCGGRLEADYRHIASLRGRRGEIFTETTRRADRWSLTGRAFTAGGRPVPIGWSGSGSGRFDLTGEGRQEEFARMLAAVDRAAAVEPGAGPVVLRPQPAAVLFHESIGHFAEAAPSPGIDLRHRLGVRLAAEGFRAVDDPLAEGGPARFEVDDEGVRSMGPTEIVRDGILVAQLHSRSTAARAGTLPTANGRMADAWSPALPRLSNLLCPTGSATEEELIETLGDGLCIHQVSHGYGQGAAIEARIVLAEKVASGRRTGAFVTGGRVAGPVDLLVRLQGLGRERVFNANAMCGKSGQILFDVGTAAPAMSLSGLEVRP